MKSYILTISLLSFVFSSKAQSCSYSFNGALSIENKLEIERQLISIPGIKAGKVRYKEDLQRGEILIDLMELDENRTEGSNQEYSPVNIKSLLIQSGLEPLDYRTFNQ